MSQNYKMIIQYEGTRYDGWQKQGNTENTIQGKLEKVLERMAGFPVEVHGSGRTDYRKARDEMQELMKAQKNVELFFAEDKSNLRPQHTR